MSTMSTSFYNEEFISGVLKMHPAECVFELDAPRKIVERITALERQSGRTDNVGIISMDFIEENLKAFKKCFTDSEIYCPHEGIDRLAECGVKSLDWELA